MKAHLKVIETKKEYELALKKFLMLFHAKTTTELEEAKLLALLIEDYESKHFVIPEPAPIEAIKFMMEQSDMSFTALGELLT